MRGREHVWAQETPSCTDSSCREYKGVKRQGTELGNEGRISGEGSRPGARGTPASVQARLGHGTDTSRSAMAPGSGVYALSLSKERLYITMKVASKVTASPEGPRAVSPYISQASPTRQSQQDVRAGSLS